MAQRLFPGFETDCDASPDLILLRNSVLSVDWSSTPAGSIADWPTEVRSTVRTALRAASPIAVLIGREGIVVCNSAAREMFGDAFDVAQGRSILDVLPIARQFFRAMIDESFRARTVRYRDHPIKLSRNGIQQSCWFNLGLSPIVDDEGRPSGTLLVASETTDHVRTRKSLNVIRQRMDIALEAGGIVGTWDYDLTTRKVAIDGALAQRYGVSQTDARNGVPIEVLIRNVYPEDRAQMLSVIDGAVSSATTIRAKFRAISKKANLNWYVAFGRPRHDDQGRITSLAGILVDVTAESEAVAALEQSNLRFDTLIEAIPQIVWSTDQDGNHDYFNKRWIEFTGIPAAAIKPDVWTQLVHPDDWDRVDQTWKRSLATGATYDIDYRFRYRDGTFRWLRVIAMPMRDSRGAILRWYGTSTDIEEAKQLQAERELVTHELGHRIKNLFALVNGLVGLSAREEPHLMPLTRQLRSRLEALHMAHDLVLKRPDAAGCSLKQLLSVLLAAYLPSNNDRVSINGSDAFLKSAASKSVALVFHELATNAVKYGAFKAEEGRLVITVDVSAEWIDVNWEETFRNTAAEGKPAGGFGSHLVQSIVERQFRGKIEQRQSDDGWTIHVRLPRSLCPDVTPA